LISRDAWLDLLAGLGFDCAVAIPSEGPLSRGARQQALVMARVPLRRREWVLVGDEGGLGAALAGRLRARGDAVVQLAADANVERLPPDSELVYLGALALVGSNESASAVQKCEALACVVPLRWLSVAARESAATRLWLVTRGAQSNATGARWQAPLWGLGRVFALEQPSKWGGLIDLPTDGDTEAMSRMVVEAVESDDLEDQVAWRGGKRHVARLLPATAPPDAVLQLHADATYLVTGGFGGLGLLVAKWMAQRGARHIALVGRNPDISAPGVRELESLGARVIPLAADVADEEAMRAHLAKLVATAPPLRGIVHAAAALSTAQIGELTSDAVQSMLRPKIAGTVVLERLTRDLELDFVVLFSSTTALLGVSGMAHYAAANAFLDATAIERNADGRRTLSVNWGTWEAMRLASAQTQRSYRAAGLEPMPAVDALAALERLLAGSEANVAVAHIDWSVLKSLHESRRVRPLLSYLGNEVEATEPANVAGAPAAAAASGAPTLLDRLGQVAASDREELLIEFVRAEVAAVLGVESTGAVAPNVGLFEMGMDSLMSVELRRRLERGAGRKLPSTLTFNYPNVAALAGYLDRELVVPEQAAPASATPVALVPEPAVITGDLDDLTDEELEARLLARLSETR
jgi:NAD(P)-dependent dehydrogenase (short-subunit alcohol dehydrogenase family)/acyl carrier protein